MRHVVFLRDLIFGLLVLASFISCNSGPLAASGSLVGDIIYVDYGSQLDSIPCGGSVSTACQSITLALNQTSNFTVIKICPGVYDSVGSVGTWTNSTNLHIVGGYIDPDCTDRSTLGVTTIQCIHNLLFPNDDSIVRPRPYFGSRAFDIIDNAVTVMDSLNVSGCHSSLIRQTDILVNNSFFSGNTGEFGGAIEFENGVMNLTNTIFTNNTAQFHGGAISLDASSFNIFNCSFSLNRANGMNEMDGELEGDVSGRGGAIFSVKGTDQTSFLTDVDFSHNEAGKDGGAIAFASLTSITILLGCSFYSNAVVPKNLCVGGDCSLRGGAIYAANSPIQLTLCKFESNSASTTEIDQAAQGGALYSSLPTVVSSFYLEVTNCTFKNNLIKGVSGGYGGAIFVLTQQLVLSHSVFEANGIGSLNSSDNLFPQYSSAGGAIYVSATAQSSETLQPSQVYNCTFLDNFVVGGGGGAVFVLSTSFAVTKSRFLSNTAWSSYTFKAQGGAMMSAKSSHVNVSDSLFSMNRALPRVIDTNPLTFSGEGGAIYSQSSSLVANENTVFVNNTVSTGQFDSGAGGGAILLEDSSSSVFDRCQFLTNGAFGLSRASTYASAGSGGAVYLKFSSVEISNCLFESNWATAGGIQYSIGGAIACFYEYLSSAESAPVVIQGTIFRYNVAFGVFSTSGGPDLRAGQGGALSVVGMTTKAVMLNNIVFEGNVADSNSNQAVFSLGGAITVSQQSFVECVACNFTNNLAAGGFGNDIATPTNSESVVSIYLASSVFTPIKNETVYRMIISQKSALEVVLKSQMRAESSATIHVDGSSSVPLQMSHRPRARTSEYASNDAALEASLSPFDDISEIFSTIIGICSTSGQIYLSKGTNFSSTYHIFLGNFISFLSDDTSGLTYTSNSSLQISGKISTDMLMITSIDSKVVVESYTRLARLNAVNGSLYFDGDIVVIGESIVTGSSFFSMKPAVTAAIGARTYQNPKINFNGTVIHGSYNTEDVLPQSIFGLVVVPSNPVVLFSGLDVFVSGEMVVTNVSTSNFMFIHLEDDSNFVITTSGLMAIRASTIIEAFHTNGTLSSSVISNYGEISISNHEDHMTTLRISGSEFVQHSSGGLNVSLNDAFKSEPIIFLESNSSLMGYINASLADGTAVNLYPPEPASSFAVLSFQRIGPLNGTDDGGASLEVISERGIGFDEVYAYGKDYTTQFTVSYLTCQSVETYYYIDQSVYQDSVSAANYMCHICLMNSSCNFCGGKCFENGLCPSEGDVFTSSCCIDNCNGRGECDAASGYSSYSCSCEFLYSGESCELLSLYSYLFIALGLFILLFGLLSLRYYYYYRKQPNRILEDLLHQLSGDKSRKEVVNSDTLQRLQQEFILKDVFVKYEEIKIEEQIGEGSFGIVFKATFRGAQVALKKLRSPMFMQLTVNDIEEFRKEAYMMSRLRHPNIVLVMGISLVGLEVNRRLSTDEADNDVEVANLPAKTLCILTEYLEQGSLADMLYGRKRILADIWNYELILICAIQAAKGMLYLHSQSPPICHRDLKSNNLVVDNHWVVKVTDFGMSRIVPDKAIGSADEAKFTEFTSSMPLDHEMTSNLGTTAWCAPEIFSTATSKARYSLPVDVYSFGMVLWELWERKRPYEELPSRFDVQDAIKSGNRPAISENCPTGLRSIIQRCWHVDPVRRPKFSYLVRYLKEELARVQRQRGVSGGGPSTGRNFLTDLLSPLSHGLDNRESPPRSNDGTNLASNDRFSSWKSTRKIDGGNLNESLMNSELPTGTVKGSSDAVGISKDSSNAQPLSWRDRYVMRFSGWRASTPDVGLAPSLTNVNVKQVVKGNVSVDFSVAGCGRSESTGTTIRNPLFGDDMH